jgi:hypothetical protein
MERLSTGHGARNKQIEFSFFKKKGFPLLTQRAEWIENLETPLAASMRRITRIIQKAHKRPKKKSAILEEGSINEPNPRLPSLSHCHRLFFLFLFHSNWLSLFWQFSDTKAALSPGERSRNLRQIVLLVLLLTLEMGGQHSSV